MKTTFFVVRPLFTGLLMLAGWSHAEESCCGDSVAAPPVPVVIPSGNPPTESVLTPTTVSVNTVAPRQEAPPSVRELLSDPTDDRLRSITIEGEPLVAVRPATPEQRQMVAAMLLTWTDATVRVGRQTILDNFLVEHQQSPWRLSIQLVQGLSARRAGALSKAREYWNQAIVEHPSPRSLSFEGRAHLGRCYAELAQLYVWLGRAEDLSSLFDRLDATELAVRGAAASRLSDARMALATMRKKPHLVFKCGPYAIDGFCRQLGLTSDFSKLTRYFDAERQGTNLAQMQGLGEEVGLKLIPVRRAPGAAIIAPAIMHWKLDHFSFVAADETTQVLIRDQNQDAFQGREFRVERHVFDAETSGYFLIQDPGTPLPSGWTRIDTAEAAQVWGKGCSAPTNPDPDDSGPDSPQIGGPCGEGMPGYSLQIARVAFRVSDYPMSYQPPKGPAVAFSLSYEQQESHQPAVLNYGNVGSKWSHNWMSYVIVTDETNRDHRGPYAVEIAMPNGGYERYAFPASDPNWYSVPYPGPRPPHPAVLYANDPYYKSGAVMRCLNGEVYERIAMDGSKLIFGRRDTTYNSGGPRWATRYFLTGMVDPFGNGNSVSYDAQTRITGVTDALGQVTTFTYGDADPYHITRVTDPFGRAVNMSYADGNLISVTDVVGLTSSFSYQALTDKMLSMTTPYGTTTFNYSENPTTADRTLIVTDPLGDQEKVAYFGNNTLFPADPLAAVPVGMNANTSFNNATLYWDRVAMRLYPEDQLKAVCYTWALINNNLRSSLMESVKPPLQNRTWFLYPNQTSTKFYVSGLGKPIKVGRVIDGGQTQIIEYAYDGAGRVTMVKDPLGRTTKYYYTGSLLTQATQSLNAGSEQILMSVVPHATYPSLPDTIIEPSGQRTRFEYNTAGQVTKIHPPQRAGKPLESTTLAYAPTTGYLTSITDPANGVTTLAYDGFGRLRTVTGNDGYATVTDYDALNRITRVTYPDTTYEQFTWNRLDPEWLRDREGRWTRMIHDARQRMVAVQDPAGGTTTFGWCNCGALASITDALGQQTVWGYDLQGRVVSKAYANRDLTVYAYQPASGRLASIKDPKGQIQSFAYHLDNTLASFAYSNATVATAGVSYVYDPVFPRLVSVTDGVGTTSYVYNPYPLVIPATPTTGSGEVASVDGPLVNDTISYTYDEWNRITTSNIAGSARSRTFDALGRVQTIANSLGSFTMSYVGSTSRVSGVALPGGMQAIYGWTAVNQDARLASIRYQRSDASRISEHTYTYAGDGRVSTWTIQNDNLTPVTWNYGYDRLEQLLSATKRQGGTFLGAQGWSYDRAGNRRSAQSLTPTSGSVWSGSFNVVNQLLTAGPGGKLRVIGHLDEAGTVKVNGVDTPVESDKSFSQLIDVAPGATTFSVEATDLKGNKRTASYRVDTTAGLSNRALSFDANGNCLNDGQRTYIWDAANRLVEIIAGTARTRMTYDGNGQRIRIEEFSGASLVSERRFLWHGGQLLEERDGAGAVLKRYFPQGVQVLGGSPGVYLYTHDHLGSVREVVNTSGVVQARYEYDSWGVRTKISGSLDVDAGYTGHFHLPSSGLILTWFRAYDPVAARWLSRDPIAESGGLNLYAYVGNNPINDHDPLGLLGFFDMLQERNERLSEARAAAGGCYTGAAGQGADGNALMRGLAIGMATSFLPARYVAMAGIGIAGFAAYQGDWSQAKSYAIGIALGYGIGQVMRPLFAAGGKPSTADLLKGTTRPRNLREQLAVEQAMSRPGAGIQLPMKMSDPRWPAQAGWVKMQQVVKPGGGEGPINVHYLYNTVTGAVDDFKIVVPGVR